MTGAAAGAGVVRRTAERRGKAARWRADAHQLTTLARGAVQRAACWESCGARVGARFPDLPAPAPPGTTSTKGPYPAASKNPCRHRQPEAHARGSHRGDRRPARATSGHTRASELPLRDPRARALGWRWQHGLLHAAGYGPSVEVARGGGGWRRKERGGRARWGGEVDGGEGGLAWRWWKG